MPFVQRIIEPKYLSHKSLLDENGKSLVSDYELDAVTNNTLSNVLRQLASVVLVANDIFEDLAKQLQDVHHRSCKLKTTIHLVEEKLAKCDPKTVTVPESDMVTFSLRTIHFKSSHPVTTGLFTTESRPNALRRIYESAVPTPVHTIRKLDRFRKDGTRSSKFFVCTPVLGGRKRRYNKKIDLEIETRKPVAVEDLRRWTSTEAMGDITVLPDNTSKIAQPGEVAEGDVKDEVDHLLPSPEEQMMAVAMRFPPSIVAVDVTGKPFDRMTGMRRSLINMEITSDGAGARRRSKSRRHRGKRRNTIAGTSEKEIQQAIAGEATTETEGYEFEPLAPLRSKSSDLFKLPKIATSPTDNIKNHFNTLKNWSKTKLKLMNKSASSDSCRPSFQGSDVVDDVNIYETIVANGKRRREKERKPSTSSSAISIQASTSSIATSLAVKLRENSLQRRHRRKGTNKGQEEPVHSSSGNWSASSESGRTSIASETTAPPKSSTTTSSNSLNHHHHPPPSVQSRRRYLNASTSSSVSEGTLTPDINDMQFHDLDGETSSVYSCDTEGYYTSFHMDSGLKTLKEEEIALSFSTLQLQEVTTHSTTTFNNSSGSGSTVKTCQMTAENEYELFGKGSTSTTTSSAGTVCTTLLANGHGYGSSRSLSQFAPAVPERKSSLERKCDKKPSIKGKGPDLGEIDLSNARKYDLESTSTVVALIHDSPSPDSGHNTSSSPAGSASQNSNSPHEHLEFSESDLEGCDRIERIRSKTAMTSCRIPSMCAITPPQSDDEVSLRNYNHVPYGVKFVPLNQYETLIQNGNAKNKSPLLNGRLFAQSNGNNKPLHIQIPTVPDLKKEITDIYALPDKSKKTKVANIKTVSTNGVLETNLDALTDDAKSSMHIIVNRESGYATIKKEFNKAHRAPSPSGGVVVVVKERETETPKPFHPILKSSLLPTNFIEKFRGVVSKQKKSEKKNDDGDYVMIVDLKNSPKTDLKHSKDEEKKSEYVSLNEIPVPKNLPENPLASSNDSSLERKKRQGARVTLDSEGKVVYSSDSLKRKKQHSTFIPGKFVRESPTPSPIPDHRVPKTIRPVNCSGLIRTNSDDRKTENQTLSPQLGKIIIKAGNRICNSPTKDFVRMPPSRVVSPTHTPKKRTDRGVRVVLENGILKNRSSSPASSEASTLERRRRCTSPSSSSSSSNDTKKPEVDNNSEEGPLWVSQHPSASQYSSPSGYPRDHPMYWTLPSRKSYSQEKTPRYGRVAPQPRPLNLNLTSNPMSDNYYQNFRNRKLNSNLLSSSHGNGAIGPSMGLTSAKLVQEATELLSSTPTKGPSKGMNLSGLVSPILASPKTTMTSEEIFAAIHKSKKKLNVSESRSSSASPSSDGSRPGSRLSWSPEEAPAKLPGSRRSWAGAGTSINAFKKLLLQQSTKKDTKLSAVEQLRLSRPDANTRAIHKESPPTPQRPVLTPRGKHQWRFSSPRTDVLSSTILEDCSEVEKSEDAFRHSREMNRPDVGNQNKLQESPKKSPHKLQSNYTSSRQQEENAKTVRHQNSPQRRQEEKMAASTAIENTRKYLQQARLNFFNSSPNSVGLPCRSQLQFPSNSALSADTKRQHDRRRSPIISLETAL